MKVFDFVQQDCISPNGKFYYKIKDAESINPSAFACRIAFYDADDNLLYHHKNASAHELNDPELIAELRAKMLGEPQKESKRRQVERNKKLKLVSWSKQGNMVYILEYHAETQYYDVFISLSEQFQIWALMGVGHREIKRKIPDEIITSLGVCYNGFDEEEVLMELGKLGLDNKKPLTKDKIKSRNIFQILFGRGKWYK